MARNIHRLLLSLVILLSAFAATASAGIGDGSGFASVSPNKVLAGTVNTLAFEVRGDGSNTLSGFDVGIPALWGWTGNPDDILILNSAGCPGVVPKVSSLADDKGTLFYSISFGIDTNKGCAISDAARMAFALRNLVADTVARSPTDVGSIFPVYTLGASSAESRSTAISRPLTVETIVPKRIDLTVRSYPILVNSTTVVSVRVIDAQGRAVSGVGVSVSNPEGTFDSNTGLTDADGVVDVLWHAPSSPGLTVFRADSRAQASASIANFSLFRYLPANVTTNATAGPATLSRPTPLPPTLSLPSIRAPSPAPQDNADSLILNIVMAAVAVVLAIFIYYSLNSRAKGRRRRR